LDSQAKGLNGVVSAEDQQDIQDAAGVLYAGIMFV
jgi:hypothetical protein